MRDTDEIIKRAEADAEFERKALLACAVSAIPAVGICTIWAVAFEPTRVLMSICATALALIGYRCWELYREQRDS